MDCFFTFQIALTNVDTLSRGMNHSLSYSSSCISEFFDAREYNTDHDGNDDDSMDSSDEDTVSTSDDDLVKLPFIPKSRQS